MIEITLTPPVTSAFTASCRSDPEATVEPRRPRVGGQREREREREGEGDSRVKRRSALTILPGPSPLTQTRIDVMPALCKRLAIASPVACAATVVPLRQFLNPSVPCPRDPPLVSVTCPAKRATHAGPAHQDLLACRVASDASDARLATPETSDSHAASVRVMRVLFLEHLM